MSTNGYLACSILCSGVTSVDFGAYSSIVGIRPFAALCACAPAGRPILSNANNATPPQASRTKTHKTQVRNFIVTCLGEVSCLCIRKSSLHSEHCSSPSHHVKEALGALICESEGGTNSRTLRPRQPTAGWIRMTDQSDVTRSGQQNDGHGYRHLGPHQDDLRLPGCDL